MELLGYERLEVRRRVKPWRVETPLDAACVMVVLVYAPGTLAWAMSLLTVLSRVSVDLRFLTNVAIDFPLVEQALAVMVAMYYLFGGRRFGRGGRYVLAGLLIVIGGLTVRRSFYMIQERLGIWVVYYIVGTFNDLLRLVVMLLGVLIMERVAEVHVLRRRWWMCAGMAVWMVVWASLHAWFIVELRLGYVGPAQTMQTVVLVLGVAWISAGVLAVGVFQARENRPVINTALWLAMGVLVVALGADTLWYYKSTYQQGFNWNLIRNVLSMFLHYVGQVAAAAVLLWQWRLAKAGEGE